MTSTLPRIRPQTGWMRTSARRKTLAFMVLAAAASAHAARILVPADIPTIGGAIGAAVEGDTIEVCEGTYNEHRLEFLGKSIVVESSNPKDPAVVAATVIQGDYTEPLVLFLSDEDSTTTLQGFTLTGGAGLDDYPQERGGALSTVFASPTIRYCVVEENYARGDGGGIRIRSGSPVVEYCVFRGNYCEGEGGGAYVKWASAVFRWCSFEENETGIPVGGGVSVGWYSDVVFESCQFVGNFTHTWGGGLSVVSSDAVLRNCVIEGNTARGGGGGVLCVYRTPVLIGCTIIGNQSDDPGSAMLLQVAGGPDLFNCIVADNTGGEGFVVYASGEDADLQVENCTFTGNWTGEDGAILLSNSVRESTFQNTIIWGNGESKQPWAGNAPLVSYSNIQGGANTSSAGVIDQDPQFLTYRGFDYVVRPTSPCVDSGDPALTDGISDWHPRWPQWYPNAPRSDMGAYGGPQNSIWIEGSEE